MSTRDVVSGQMPDEPGTSVSTQHGVTTRVTLDPDGSFVVAQTVDVTPNGPEADSLPKPAPPRGGVRGTLADPAPHFDT